MRINSIASFGGTLKAGQDEGAQYHPFKEIKTTPEQDKLIMAEFKELLGDSELTQRKDFTTNATSRLSRLFADIFGEEYYMPPRKPSPEESMDKFFKRIEDNVGVRLDIGSNRAVDRILTYLINNNYLTIPNPAICGDDTECIEISGTKKCFVYEDCSMQVGYTIRFECTEPSTPRFQENEG
jgi:hypothetical protein